MLLCWFVITLNGFLLRINMLSAFMLDVEVLSVVMLGVVMLSVVMLGVVMQNGVAPICVTYLSRFLMKVPSGATAIELLPP
jgi:hypothetical protein